jgi:hypothetical protein
MNKQNKQIILLLLKEFYPYAKKRLKFTEGCSVKLVSDCKNAQDPLGKTAYYDPENRQITVYIKDRHVKDILRSVSHELVHHTQNCRGDLDGMNTTSEGYAQNDKHLREMEKEAYLEGNLTFRDWEDSRKRE